LIIICGILLIGAVIAATAGLLLNLRDRAITERERELKTLSSVVAEQIDHNFQSIEIIQTAVIERMQSLGIASAKDYEGQMSGYDTHQRLKDRISASPYIDEIVLTDNQGKLINFSRSWPIPSLKVPDQDPSEAFKSDPHLTSFVGKPMRSPATGNWVVSIARKFTGPNGEFLGVVTGVMELQYFEQLFEAIAVAPNGSIALLRHDGTLLVRYPRYETAIGQSISHSGLFENVLSKSDHGLVRQIGAIDGKQRLISARTLSHNQIVVITTTTVADALADWKRAAITMTDAALIIGLVIGGVVVFSVWQVGKNLREKNFRLDTALSNMSQGLIMFDSTARLVICNDRYRQIYNLPPELVKPGCAVRDLLKHSVANGTFSGDPEQYVNDLLAAIAKGKPASQEVKTGDGRTIAVVNHPTADGGWVATHEDITKQQRAEKERDRNREFLDLIIENVPTPIFVKEASDRRYVLVNQAGENFWGTSRAKMIGKTSYDVFPLEEADRIAAREDQLLQSDRPIIDERQIRTPCNGIRTIVSRRLVVRDNGKPRYVIGVMEDITERKQAEDEIRRTKKFLDTVIEHVPTPIAVKDVPSSAKDARDCRFTLLNRAGEELLGVPRQQIIGKTAAELYPKESADIVIADDSKALCSEQMMLTCDYPLITPGNGTRLVTARKIAIRGNDGKPQYLLAVLDDVTERRKSEQRIEHMAHYDTLTDLPNRATFNETIEATLDRAGASGEQFAVLSIDLDGFKETNDTYGHLIGDALLREVARRLQAAAEGALIARIGGDEFAAIVADGEQPAAAAALAERLLAAFVDDFAVEGQRLKLGVSIGAAVYPTDGTDAKTLMVNADAALYRAKAEFRGMALFFESEMGARLRERHALQEDLRSAIDRGELLLHYQPQKKMSGETIGFEALVRWQCPKRGMVAPGTFIPVAEESSLIIPIGEWVLRQACREAASWPQPLTIAANISPIQFRQGDLPRLVHSILLETGLAPGRLELEITEGVMINDLARAVSILRRLKSLGVKIAMDDFGTGYSSLSYLQSFRCDKIKIDRVFICDLEHNHHSKAVVRAVVGLGRTLDLPILAEGVETEAQHALLMKEGCDEVQGYLTGRPLPIADYADLVGRQAVVQKSYAVGG
jgi:diguanylate cyclase (GGDEF)-like protein/PAS domain S-box-containing protein